MATDYTDLFPIMAFFRGGRDGAGAHDDLAKEIGLAGKHWAANHWREVDMQVSNFPFSLVSWVLTIAFTGLLLLLAHRGTSCLSDLRRLASRGAQADVASQYDRIMNRDDNDPKSMDM